MIAENTSKNTHNIVVRLLDDEQGHKVILDVPCGEGAFTKRMLAQGADVFSADCLDILRLPHEQFSIVDMDRELPYPDEVFDAVVCTDGIEHLERPFDFIKECYRIIRKGGVISTSNLMALRSRWRWLRTGFHQGEKTPLPRSQSVHTPHGSR